VTAGFNDADFALALGVVPVGVADFIGPFPETTRSWAREPLAGARPEVVTSGTGELLLERIAALDPDVIVYYSYLEDAEDYRRLAAIAPTVVEPRAGTLWQRHTLDVGRALGRERQAREQVRRVQARFAREREAHPEFAGTTAAVFFPTSSGPDYYLLEPEDPRTGLFTTLGFRMPEVTGPISRERAALLDQDLLVVVGTTREELQDDPLVTRLNAVREGRVAYLGGFEGEFAGALGFDSPLSLPVALDLAVPALAEALRGA
jgi:iron complex transport system substrate-binding protein